MVEINRNLMTYNAVMPRWFITLLAVGGLLVGISMLVIDDKAMLAPKSAKITEFPKAEDWRDPASVEPPATSPPLSEFSTGGIANKPVVFFGIAFCSVAAAISVLVLLMSLPVFLFSSDIKRVARAGGLVKTATKGVVVIYFGALVGEALQINQDIRT